MHYGSMRHDYSGRKIKKRKPKGEVYAKYTPPKFTPLSATKQPTYADIRMAEAKQYRSVDIRSGVCAKEEAKTYTGTLVKGISTLHKSNAVPIISETEAKDHANMRR